EFHARSGAHTNSGYRSFGLTRQLDDVARERRFQSKSGVGKNVPFQQPAMHGRQELIIDLRPKMVFHVVAEVDLADKKAFKPVTLDGPDERPRRAEKIRRVGLATKRAWRLVLGYRAEVKEEHLHGQQGCEPQEEIGQRVD